MTWGTEWMLDLLGKTEIREIVAEAHAVSGYSFAYKDNVTLETFACSESEEFLCAVRAYPLREIFARFDVREISENNIVRGYLVAGGDAAGCGDGKNLIEIVMTAIRLLLRRDITRKTQEAGITGNLFAELIGGQITTQEALASRLRLLGMRFPWSVAVLSTECPQALRGGERYLQELLFSRANSFYPGSYVYRDGALFSCILALKRVPAASVLRRDMQAIAAQARAEMEAHLGAEAAKSYWGGGKAHASLLSLQNGYDEAAQSVLYAKIYRRGEGGVVFWNDTGAFRLMARWAASRDAVEFYAENIGPFRGHEYLLETLDGLDACNWNLSLAAERLACHYNTLKYRYKKIKEILTSAGRDIEDHETRFDISVSLKLHKIYQERGAAHEEEAR